MVSERLNKTETQILRLFPSEPMTVSQIASELEVGVSWASRCVSHLSDLGFLSTNRDGMQVFVQISSNSLGERLLTLLTEEPALSLNALMGGSKLSVLPLLLPPGYSSSDISVRARITMRTVQLFMRSWRAMGMVVLDDGLYSLNPRHELIVDFVRGYSHHRNMRRTRSEHPDASLVWEDRDEFIISVERYIEDDRYTAASTTAISRLGYDIMYRNNYYYYSPVRITISEAEALVQNLMCDLRNPRSGRYIRKAVREKRVTKSELRKHAKKYGVEAELEKVMRSD